MNIFHLLPLTLLELNLGVVGVLVNGVAVYNDRDGRSYMNQGQWNQNAIVAEALGFDARSGTLRLSR